MPSVSHSQEQLQMLQRKDEQIDSELEMVSAGVQETL